MLHHLKILFNMIYVIIIEPDKPNNNRHGPKNSVPSVYFGNQKGNRYEKFFNLFYGGHDAFLKNYNPNNFLSHSKTTILFGSVPFAYSAYISKSRKRENELAFLAALYKRSLAEGKCLTCKHWLWALQLVKYHPDLFPTCECCARGLEQYNFRRV